MVYQCGCGRYIQRPSDMLQHCQTKIHERWLKDGKTPVKGASLKSTKECSCGNVIKKASYKRHLKSNIHKKILETKDDDHSGIIYELTNDKGDVYVGSSFLPSSRDVLDTLKTFYLQYKQGKRNWQKAFELFNNGRKVKVTTLVDKCECIDKHSLNLIRKNIIENY